MGDLVGEVACEDFGVEGEAVGAVLNVLAETPIPVVLADDESVAVGPIGDDALSVTLAVMDDGGGFFYVSFGWSGSARGTSSFCR